MVSEYPYKQQYRSFSQFLGLKAIVSHFMDCFDDALTSIHWHCYWAWELENNIFNCSSNNVPQIHNQFGCNIVRGNYISKAPSSKAFFNWFLEAKTKLLKNLGVINHSTCLGFRSIKFLVSKKATLACKHCDTKRVIVLY